MPPRKLYEQRRRRRTARARLINNNKSQTRAKETSIVDQIVQLVTPQVTENPLECDFYNGTAFQYQNNALEPTGWFS
jgi:hypothetical protein